MSWFKILLLVLFGLQTILDIAKSSGWRPTIPNWACAAAAVEYALIFVGIWLWV